MVDTQWRSLQQQIKYFTLVTTYIHTMAVGATNVADNLLCKPVVALVFRENERERFEYFFDCLFQTSNISENSTKVRRRGNKKTWAPHKDTAQTHRRISIVVVFIAWRWPFQPTVIVHTAETPHCLQ